MPPAMPPVELCMLMLVRESKVSIIPVTVPKSPISGARVAIVTISI